jgi:hypothetical protein
VHCVRDVACVRLSAECCCAHVPPLRTAHSLLGLSHGGLRRAGQGAAVGLGGMEAFQNIPASQQAEFMRTMEQMQVRERTLD